MPELPTGTVTFLFTDIAGSTQLLQRLGADAYAAARDQHHRLMRTAFTDHGGIEVDTQGDAFFVAFPTAPHAVAAAVEATRVLAEATWPDGTALRVRMGLHTGTPLVAGDHYVGLDVVRAARIAAAGHGGQVLVSEATRTLAEAALPDGVSLRNMGAHRLKDLQRPEPLCQLVVPELRAEFPPLKTLDSHPHNLPIQPTPLLGREEQVAAVIALLRRDGVRLVTLTGPGGIGKTRLGVQVAGELVEDFPDGVWFVRLSRLTDPTLVVPTIAQTLGLKEHGSQPIAETLQEHLRTKRTLLLLDNFEQVVGAVTEVAGLLAVCPGVRVLATSRLPLRLRGEKVCAVPPLPLATSGDAQVPERVAQFAAVALFIERARDARSDFMMTAANAPAIADICARLDGLPLAIELAAARVRMLPPEALLARLAQGLHLLTGGARDLEARQQTMRATIAWSEALLTPAERVLFQRLAVFVGGCTLEAAEAVCTAPEGAEPLGLDMLEGLGTLVDHSLMYQREEGGEARFVMLHVIREYALEQLEASGEAEALRRAHLMYYLALAEAVEPELLGEARLGPVLVVLEREHDNLRAALGWAQRQGEVALGLRLAGALVRFWRLRGHRREGREWLDAMLALDATGEATGRVSEAVPSAVQAKALFAAGELAAYQDDFSRAEPLLAASLHLAREAGDEVLTTRVLNRLGFAAQHQDDLTRATAWYEQSLALARKLGDQTLISIPLGNLGTVAYLQGDLLRAEANSAAVVAMDRQTGDQLWLPYDLALLSAIRLRQGNLPESLGLLQEAFTLLRDAVERGWPLLSVNPLQLVYLARVLAVAGRGEQAARFLGAGEALLETFGVSRVAGASNQADIEAAIAPARSALGEAAWATAYAAGQALTLEEAIAEALEATEH
jgi:predicted ATPase/class 3 adenylate cyclase